MGKNNIEMLKLAEKYKGCGGQTFRKFAGLGSGEPWCCAFVSYIFKEGGNKSLFYNGRVTTYCPNAIKWCQANLAQIPIYLAMPMDIIFFDWEPNGYPNHIGFVRERHTDQDIYTIEGNTSGGIVAYKDRPLYGRKNGKKVQYIQGVFRPHYKAKYDISKALKIDGLFDYNSIAMLQKVLGLKVDGILGKDTVKAFQKKVGVSSDGSWGPKTSKAVQKKICGFKGDDIDGEFGPRSVKSLQRWINTHMKFSNPVEKKATPTVKPVSTQEKTPVKISEKPSETKVVYSGRLPNLRVKKTAKQVREDALKWGKMVANDNTYHYGHGDAAHHNGCPFCGTEPKVKMNSNMKDPDKTLCCNPFVHACFAHGGQVPSMLKLCRNGKSYGFTKNEGYAKSSQFKSVKNLEPGDVACSNSHVALYAGDGKFVQAGHEDDNVKGSKSWNSSIDVSSWNGWIRGYRFVGSVDKDMALNVGEYSNRVVLWQKFLNWYFKEKVVKVDGIFGNATAKYTKKFKKEQGLNSTSAVAEATLKKAKVVKR